MAQPRLRVALDTNVLIAGIVWPRCRTKCSVQRWPGTSTSCCRSKWSKRSDRDFTDPGALAERFSRDVKIMLPAVFLRDVLGWSPEALDVVRSRTWHDFGS